MNNHYFADFIMAEEIIQKAEKIKLKRLKKEGNETMLKRQHMTLTLSDVIEGYQNVMSKHGCKENSKEHNHYYAMIVKLSLNQRGKTWRECINIEKIVSSTK